MSELMLVNFLVMIFLVFIQSYFYFKLSVKSMVRFPVMSLTASFSLIISPMLMTNEVPATPYIQIFFIFYQILLFFFASIEYIKVKKGKKG